MGILTQMVVRGWRWLTADREIHSINASFTPLISIRITIRYVVLVALMGVFTPVTTAPSTPFDLECLLFAYSRATPAHREFAPIFLSPSVSSLPLSPPISLALARIAHFEASLEDNESFNGHSFSGNEFFGRSFNCAKWF